MIKQERRRQLSSEFCADCFRQLARAQGIDARFHQRHVDRHFGPENFGGTRHYSCHQLLVIHARRRRWQVRSLCLSKSRSNKCSDPVDRRVIKQERRRQLSSEFCADCFRQLARAQGIDARFHQRHVDRHFGPENFGGATAYTLLDTMELNTRFRRLQPSRCTLR